jgi:hypothetical protein
MLLCRSVLARSNSEGFFERNIALFRRAAQLCDPAIAARYAEDREFPGSLERERELLLRYKLEPMRAQNWNLDIPLRRLWDGQRRLNHLCRGLNAADIGSRSCILRTLRMAERYAAETINPQ